MSLLKYEFTATCVAEDGIFNNTALDHLGQLSRHSSYHLK